MLSFLSLYEIIRGENAMADQENMVDVDKDMNPILRKGNYEYWKTMTEASLVFLGC